MNTEEQIQKRAKIVASGFASALSPENLAALERGIASELVAQQSAAEAAHHDWKARAIKAETEYTIDPNSNLLKMLAKAESERDAARAELAKLSETISRITEVARSANELLATCGYTVSITTIPSI